MPAARIIPCLDVRDGRVVKGVQFRDHRDVGDVVEHALRYRDEGADEIVFYDIAASAEGRRIDPAWVRRVSDVLDIPFAVAGGIDSRDAAAMCLNAGADKISVNSPAIANPALIGQLARDFGAQCVVIGIDSLADADGFWVQQFTGTVETRRDTRMRTIDWAVRAADLGAGEIVLNCMNRDGVRRGYDIAQTRAVIEAVSIPVVASGGAGAPEHFREAFEIGCSGALAATVFHDRLIAIPELKDYLVRCGIEMRH